MQISTVSTDGRNESSKGFCTLFFLNVAGSIAIFEFFRAVAMKIIVCWDVSSCSL